jgi:hypothetical protein
MLIATANWLSSKIKLRKSPTRKMSVMHGTHGVKLMRTCECNDHNSNLFQAMSIANTGKFTPGKFEPVLLPPISIPYRAAFLFVHPRHTTTIVGRLPCAVISPGL